MKKQGYYTGALEDRIRKFKHNLFKEFEVTFSENSEQILRTKKARLNIKMKVVLVNPPAEQNVIRRWRCAIEQGHYLFPPTELCYLAGILKQKKGSKYRVIDCVADKTDYNNLIRKLKRLSPDLIVFMPGFEAINKDIKGMEAVNEHLNSKLLAFGFYPTIFYKDLLKKYKLDYILLGEPELTFSELYDKLDRNLDLDEVKGLAYKKGTEIKMTGLREEMKNLDDLPFPDMSHLKMNRYFSGFSDKKPFTTIITGRGCSYRCTYCIRSYGDRFRQRSVKNVIDEISFLVKRYNIRSLRILDDTFTTNKKWVKEFCTELLRKKFRLQWSCLSRPETLSPEIIPLMKKAGCNRVLIGIESGSEKILKKYKRYYKLDEKIKHIFKTLRENKIESFAFFLLGAPDETEEDIMKSIEVAIDLDPDYITLNMMRVYPGTEDFEILKGRNQVEFSLIPYKSRFKARLSEKKIRKLLFEFYRAFYFRPKWFYRMMPKLIFNPVFSFNLAKEYLKWELKNTNIGNKQIDAKTKKNET